MPRSCSAPISPRMVRLSILEVTWKEIRVGKFALIVPVMTSTEGRWVAMMRWMPRRAGHLGEALDAGLDLLAGDHHQVGHLVDDDDDVGHRLGAEFFRLEHRLAGILVEAGLDGAGEGLVTLDRVLHAGVVAVDVAHAHLGHLAVALLHLGHGPFQGHDGLFRIGDDGGEQVRDAVIDAELQHLGVDHDQAALVGREPVEQRQDHGVDGDGFA